VNWFASLRGAHALPTSDSAVDVYEGAVRSVERAWQGTALLSWARDENVQRAMRVLSNGDAEQIAGLLGELAHESYSVAAPLIPGLDPEKVTKLSAIVIGLISHAGAAAPVPRVAEDVASSLIDEGRSWIRDGVGSHSDLARIAQLVGGDALVRGTLIAPLAPAAATLRCVARAGAAHFAFQGRSEGARVVEPAGV
jgi:hypothetical protein